MRFVLLVSLVGCSRVFGLEPAREGGVGDDEAGVTGDGSVMIDPDATVIDAVVFDVAPDVPMGSSCWSTQTGDEDGDQVVNGCDNCPADVNPQQEDADQDGVGNLCDPHGTGPPDHIVHFEGFGGTLAGWVTIGGTWSVSNGAFVQTKVRASTLAYLDLVVPNPTVDLRIRRADPPADNGVTEVGAFATANAITANPTGLVCVDQQVGTPGIDRLILRDVGKGQEAEKLHSATIPLRMFVLSQAGGLDNPACVLISPDTTTGTITTVLLPTPAPTQGRVALYTTTVAEFTSILVTTR